MRVDISSLRGAEIGQTLDYTVRLPSLADPGLATLRDFTAAGTVTVLEDRLLVAGRGTATAKLTCARCLEPFEQAVEAAFSEEYSLRPEEHQFGYHGSRLELTPLLHDVLLLALPARPLHDPDCRGLCPVCGKDLNKEPHDHRTPPADNPFKELKKALPKEDRPG